jgi:GST-like protein
VTIELYTWSTPNGRKISIALEELGLDYAVHPINITKDEQFAPDFLKISPHNKIPAIVDSEGPDGKPISLRRGLFPFHTAGFPEVAQLPLLERAIGEL